MDRRRTSRGRVDGRQSLERALDTWQLLDQAWTLVLEAARKVDNWERMALAETKLEECRHEIVRLEELLAAK